MENIKLLYIDLFCGAGGTSTGVETANYKGEKCAKVIVCVNHDAKAIASHAANHPDVMHFTEDIRTLELSPLVSHVEKMKAIYPEALVVLWASLECTNFSKAKGGKPRDADSRTLGLHLFKYIKAIQPNYIQIENVEEFMTHSWTKSDKNGKVIKDNTDFLKWVERIKSYGYDFKHRILNAADYGAYTSRKRFFGIFAKQDLPIVFPKPTHSKTGSKDLFDTMKKWKPVKDVLDFSDEGESIFTRKKPLSDKTLERIYAGLIKFVAGGKDKWILKYNSTKGATGGNQELVQAQFLGRYNGQQNQEINAVSVDKPAPTLTVVDRLSLISPHFIVNEYSNGGQLAIEVYETDTEPMISIKQFMALYGIIDIKIRMLKIPELKRIMGFTEDYTLIGTQAEQKKYIGNAVEVNMARVLCEALVTKLYEAGIFKIEA